MVNKNKRCLLGLILLNILSFFLQRNLQVAVHLQVAVLEEAFSPNQLEEGQVVKSHHLEKREVVKYHEWGPEGIQIGALIAFFRNRLFNYYGYKSEKMLKNHRKAPGRHEFLVRNPPFLAIIGFKNNETSPNVYFSSKVFCKGRQAGIRLSAIIPELNQALSVDLIKSSNWQKYPSLITALKDSSIPILFYPSDWGYCAKNEYDYIGLDGTKQIGSVPKLTYSYIKDCGYNFAIPDYNIFKLAQQNKTDLVEERNNYPNWESQIKKAVWRGCIDSNINREKMLNLVRNNTNFDVANVEWLSKSGEYMPMVDYMKYRAVLDIDGRAWTDRFQNLLCLKTVVIKIVMNYTSYFTVELTPGVHYLPASLENLTEVVEYAISDDNSEEMKSIVSRANEWCDNEVVPSKLRNNMLSILDGYADELYRADANWTNTWNNYSQEFLIGERAWNATGGWVSSPTFNRSCIPLKQGEVDFTVAGLTKKQTLFRRS